MNNTLNTLSSQMDSIVNTFGEDAVMTECDTFYSSVYASPSQTVKSLMEESDCSFMELVCDIDPNFEMNLKLDTLICCIINSDGEDAGGMILASNSDKIIKEINESNLQSVCDWE